LFVTVLQLASTELEAIVAVPVPLGQVQVLWGTQEMVSEAGQVLTMLPTETVPV
jgi:hypothetical protein